MAESGRIIWMRNKENEEYKKNVEIRKNDEFELTIEDMSEDGAGIGKQDGYIWFVKDAVIGDRIRARAMKMKKITALPV